jgi:hypothetical protein
MPHLIESGLDREPHLKSLTQVLRNLMDTPRQLNPGGTEWGQHAVGQLDSIQPGTESLVHLACAGVGEGLTVCRARGSPGGRENIDIPESAACGQVSVLVLYVLHFMLVS